MRLSRSVLFDTRGSLSVEPISASSHERRCRSQKQSRIDAICTPGISSFSNDKMQKSGKARKSLREDELPGFAVLAYYGK
jgi:hypothetical protein